LIPFSTYVYLVMAAVFWGGTFVVGRQLAPLLDPYASAFLRFLLASILLSCWLYWRLRRFPRVTARQLLAVGMLGATGVFAYNLLFFSGLQSVEAGRASLIIAANPVLIALASSWLFREHLGWARRAGIVLSVVGAMVVIARGDMVGLLTAGVGAGEWLLLGCVLSWVAYTLIGKGVLHGMSPLLAVCYSSVLGTLLLGVVVLGQGGIDAAVLANPEVWLYVGYLAVFGTVLAFVWFYKGVHTLGAARAGQFINIVPVSGVCLGAWLLDEPMTRSLLLGGMLVLLGLWLTNRPARVAVVLADKTE
jgi:drug/metabolite transporter (DMT)-like permease